MNGTANWRITVYVNGEARRTFLGLRVRRVLGHEEAGRVEQGEAVVEDAEGSRVDLDGALYDGQRLTVKQA
jgi:D-arabinose 1-dehydrogenase-like Zn-dependent alcohol dehydrogenase